MTNRENFLSTMRREGYQWAMTDFVLCPAQIEAVKEAFGTEDYESYFQFPWRDVDDVRLPGHCTEIYRPFFHKPLAQGAVIDLWGVGHESSPNSQHMTRMRHPLEDATCLQDLENYPFPDFLHGETAHQKEQTEQLKQRDLIAVGSMPMTIWETAWYLRGMENLFCDMLAEDDMAVFLLDKITQLAIFRAEAFARAGVDVLHVGDDIGMQKSTMMSVELYCKWLKPRLAAVIQAARIIKPDILIKYHSCGYMEPFIPHLMEIGVDIVNPLQSECMDFSEIHQKYGNRLSFHGTIGTQTIMPFGTPEEIKETVHRNLDIAGEKGGLLCAPTHMLEPEVPLENILAYVEACRSYHHI